MAKPVATRIILSAPDTTLLVAQTVTVTAHVFDQKGHEIHPTPKVSWQTANASVATCSTNGFVTAATIGSTVISAKIGAVIGSLPVAVSAAPQPPDPPPPDPGADVLTSVTVTPSSVNVGDTAHAFAYNQNGNLLPNVTWASAESSVATVAAGGGVTTVKAGSTSIRATLNSVTVGSTLTVSGVVPVPPPSPVITTVTLNPFSIIVGQNSQATALDQNGSVMTGVVWTSSNLTLATVGNSGLVMSYAAGVVTITGTVNSVSVSASLNIAAIVVPPPSGSPRVLRSTDLQYLGAYRVQKDNVRMDFSYGPMTGRVVGGQTRLLMSGNITLNCPVYEFAVPVTSPNVVPASAPRMTLVTTWADPYHGKRTTWDNNGNQQAIPALYPGGMHWSEAQQLLYWTYANSYNTSHLPDWSLGASTINADGSSTAYGPWRVSGGGLKGPWRCTRVSEGPSGQMLTGATLGSGNSISPWGPELWDRAFPTASTPGGFGNPDLTLTKDLTYYPMLGRMLNDGTYTGAFTACRRPGDYAFELMANAQVTQIDPTKNGGVGSWADVDTWQDVTWINLSDRVGVLYTGKLGAGHIWYSNVGIGNLNCSHGFPPPVQITGPVATQAYPALWIYDPADLAAVRNGSKIDYTVNPTETVNAETSYGLITAPITSVGSEKMISGQYFEPISRRLYIAAPDADLTVPGLAFPLVHVFQVN